MSYNLEHHEGFVGHLMALEGVSDSATMIHGPTGCKFHPSDYSERVFSERNGSIDSRNAFIYGSEYHFGQPRLPCTAVDGDNIVTGSSERSSELYRSLTQSGVSLIGVVNSPGMSLIGEDLGDMKSDVPTVVIESCEYSATVYSGFADCAKKIIDAVATAVSEKRSGVNIIGLSLFHQRAFDNAGEIGRILSLCGIEVNCFVCAGSSTEEMRKIPRAELNIVVDSDFGESIAEHCMKRFGTPYIVSVPMGFDATERFVRDVCERLGRDPSQALSDSAGWRKRTAKELLRAEKRSVQLRGRTFSVNATPCMKASIMAFVNSYLGLIPLEDGFWNTPVDVAYCSGNESASMVRRGIARGCVEICEPFGRPFGIRPRPVFGTVGAVLLIEDTVNILCGIRNDR